VSVHRTLGVLAAGLALGAGALVPAATGEIPAADAAPPTVVAPGAKPIPITGQDRLYVADQTSNTVTVIDPSTNQTLGSIPLGTQRVGAVFSPQYLESVGVHGLAFSGTTHRLAVVSVTSNTVDIVDTTTNKVVTKTDVGRASHEGSFTTDGKQFWVAARARDTLTIVDAVRGGVIANLPVGQGPSKVVMSPDGKLAYVNHITTPQITVIDVASRRIVDRITGLADAFSSDEAISPDGTELWASHKRAGKISVVDLVHRRVAQVLTTGPDTNHPQFADTPAGNYVYLSVGGLDHTLVYRRDGGTSRLVKRVQNTGHAPHGVATSGDGSRIYVGLEKSDQVDVIDTVSMKIIKTIPSGQEPQAVVYAPNAAPSGQAPNLTRQGLVQQARSVATTLPDGRSGQRLDPAKGRALEGTVRPVAGVDMIQLQARGLTPNTTYKAYSVGRSGQRSALVTFSTDANGNAPMVLAFSSFTGRSIAIESRGTAPANATPVNLAYCDCGCGCC
jgi:YVTN family beta-propeller protein